VRSNIGADGSITIGLPQQQRQPSDVHVVATIAVTIMFGALIVLSEGSVVAASHTPSGE
jgi:hypothetical protein